MLTLPAFHWIRQEVKPTHGRSRHTCNVAGNRQMIVVGGLPVTAESGVNYSANDPWPNGKLGKAIVNVQFFILTNAMVGIGVFDMSAMKWASEYDPSAASYVTPNVVKDYYRNNARYPEWASAQIKQWFTSDGMSSSSCFKTSQVGANRISKFLSLQSRYLLRVHQHKCTDRWLSRWCCSFGRHLHYETLPTSKKAKSQEQEPISREWPYHRTGQA